MSKCSLRNPAGLCTYPAGSTPVHRIEDRIRSVSYMDIQYTYDDEDGYLRVDVVKHPDTPHRRETDKFHPETSAISADLSGVDTIPTHRTDWPELSGRRHL